MAKKIKFPLILNGNKQVRTLDELRNYFDLEKVYGYFLDGKLLTWLQDRYYENEAEKVSKLKGDCIDIKKEMCNIFNIDYKDLENINLDDIVKKKRKIESVKQITDDENIIENVDYIAFDQEELEDLIDRQIEHIYLVAGDYTIPLDKSEIKYTGIGNVNVYCNISNYKEIFDKNIIFENCIVNSSITKNIFVLDNEINIVPQEPKDILMTKVFDSKYKYLRQKIKLAVGDGSFYVLYKGKVYAWGSSVYCQTACNGAQNVIDIAAGSLHSLVLYDNGKVEGFGYKCYKQADVTSSLISDKKCIAISANGHNSAALSEDNDIVLWGDNYFCPGSTAGTCPERIVSISCGCRGLTSVCESGVVEEMSYFANVINLRTRKHQ